MHVIYIYIYILTPWSPCEVTFWFPGSGLNIFFSNTPNEHGCSSASLSNWIRFFPLFCFFFRRHRGKRESSGPIRISAPYPEQKAEEVYGCVICKAEESFALLGTAPSHSQLRYSDCGMEISFLNARIWATAVRISRRKKLKPPLVMFATVTNNKYT